MLKRFTRSVDLTPVILVLSIFILSIFLLSVTGPAYAETDRASNLADPGTAGSDLENKRKNWQFILGAGVGYISKYQGSDNYETIPVPIISADYKRGLFFANLHNGIGSYFFQGRNYKIGMSVGYAQGRDEDDDFEKLRGMGDIDDSATANFLGEYDFGIARVSAGIRVMEFVLHWRCPR